MARQLKASQKIRVIVNGVIVYTKVGAISDIFGHTVQREAVARAVDSITVGDTTLRITGICTRINGVDVQVDIV